MANVTRDPPQALGRAFSAYRAGRFIEAERLCQSVVAAKRDSFDALHLLAIAQMSLGKNELALANFDRALAIRDDAAARCNRGVTLQALARIDEALASFDRALAIRPDYAEALNNRGSALKQLGRYDEALASFERAIAARPDYARAHFNHAVTLHELRRYDAALASYDRALLAQPDNIELHNNRGVALHGMKRFEEALASYDRSLALRPNYAEALNNRGATLRALRRSEEALASFDRAIAARPGYADALNNRGNVLKEMNRHEAALASYDSALSARPNYADAFNNRGIVLNELRRYDEALDSFGSALSIQPNNAEMHNNRGVALLGLRRFDEALASFDRAIAARPDYPEALNNRGLMLRELNRPEEALANYDRAIAARPDYADALNNRGRILMEQRRLGEALQSYDRALTAKPDDSYAFSGAADCAARLCDWEKRTQLAAMLPNHISDANGFVAPFVLLGYSDDPALQLQSARNYFNAKVPVPPRPLWTGEAWRHDKIRVGYLSADFYSHAVGYMVADLFETHDRSRFEIVGVSHGEDDGSDIRKRIAAAFDTFHDVRRMNDKGIADLVRDLEIDIAVDLQGYVGKERPGIFAYRPAPVQASYLGFAGTMGNQFVDYIIADKIVIPSERQRFFTEKIVHLPDCYMTHDRKRQPSASTPTRQEMGLPERGFVFCCFNNNWKLTPILFDIWMRLLHEVEGSVLWLLGDNSGARENLRREASRRGIDPSRLVFAERRLAGPQHLARHHLADLFLDTLPYNAHSTASDALRPGLPVLTCMGETFQTRVAASQLHAIGLPELIVSNLEEYQALALKLARNPALLAELKSKLRRQRDTHPLFDTERFTRGIEAAYRTMWEIWQRGEPPRSFAVPPEGNDAGRVSVEPSP